MLQFLFGPKSRSRLIANISRELQTSGYELADEEFVGHIMDRYISGETENQAGQRNGITGIMAWMYVSDFSRERLAKLKA